MAKESESFLESLLRLGVMVAVVVVGGMAYQVYGPPIDEVDDLAERAMTMAREWLDPPTTAIASPAVALPTGMAASPLGDLQPLANPAQPLSQLTPMVPLTAQPAGLPPLRGRGLLTDGTLPSEVQPLAQRLRTLGADEFHLANWGAEGALQRFECRVPLPGAGGLARHFDAIEPSAKLAVAKVCQDVQAWRQQLAVVTPR